MLNVVDLMEHIVTEIDIPDEAKNGFKIGYMSGIIDDLMLRFPEARAFVEEHATKYNYK